MLVRHPSRAKAMRRNLPITDRIVPIPADADLPHSLDHLFFGNSATWVLGPAPQVCCRRVWIRAQPPSTTAEREFGLYSAGAAAWRSVWHTRGTDPSQGKWRASRDSNPRPTDSEDSRVCRRHSTWACLVWQWTLVASALFGLANTPIARLGAPALSPTIGHWLGSVAGPDRGKLPCGFRG